KTKPDEHESDYGADQHPVQPQDFRHGTHSGICLTTVTIKLPVVIFTRELSEAICVHTSITGRAAPNPTVLLNRIEPNFETLLLLRRLAIERREIGVIALAASESDYAIVCA